MFVYDNKIYAGITSKSGVDSLNKYGYNRTGYVLQRITDGRVFGFEKELEEKEGTNLFIEIEDNIDPGYYLQTNKMIAGVVNEEGAIAYFLHPTPDTGKTFIRIHDGFEMGEVIYLGMDYSYYRDGRKRIDLPKYYMEVEKWKSNESNTLENKESETLLDY